MVHRLVFLGVLGVACLPPPRSWSDSKDTSAASDAADADSDADADADADSDADADADADVDTGTIADDTGTPPPSPQAVEFEPGGGLVMGPDSISADGFDPFASQTLDMWLKAPTGGADEPVVIARMFGSSSLAGWMMVLVNDEVIVNRVTQTVNVPVPTGEWVLVSTVMDVDATALRVYVNGTLAASDIDEWSTLTADDFDDPGTGWSLSIGTGFAVEPEGSEAWTVGTWPGLVDEVRYSQTARYTGETSDALPVLATDGAVGLWHLDGDLLNAVDVGLAPAEGTGVVFSEDCPGAD